MNEERTGKCLRQVEHICSHLWHRYSITVNQVMVATVKLSKWWLQLNQCILLRQWSTDVPKLYRSDHCMILFQSQGFFKIVTTNSSPPPKKITKKARKKNILTIFVHAFYIYKCSPTIYIQMGTGIGAYYLGEKKKKIIGLYKIHIYDL